MKVAKPAANVAFPKLEEEILAFWEQEKIFEKSVSGPTAEGHARETWSFYDGPPFATGLPHYGHLLAGTIKDVIPRYWTMRGKKVERRFGWDCHGLPIEFEVEKDLNLKGRQDILNFGVSKFNEACRAIVLRHAHEWEKTVNRVARWIDFKNDYKTMDLDFMESVWAVFKKLWEKGLIYEDKKVLPYSTPVASPLSNFEANLNYQDTQDPSVFVKLPLFLGDQTFLVIWTTTPWTLPANLGVALNPEFTYVKVKDAETGEVYIGHEKLLPAVLERAGKKCSESEAISGQELVGLRYKPLFPSAFPGKIPAHAHHTFSAEYVSAESGTGLVHLAPAFGEDDFTVGKKNNLEALDHLDEQGHFTKEASIATGKYFKEADKDVIAYLKEKGLLLKQETIQHNYPFCYRSDTPLIYRAISTWFVKVTAIKEELLANNRKVHWVPEHLKEGRFGKWLEGAKDWAISRNRFWGNPIPVWRNDDTGEMICVGSRAELEKLSGKTFDDLHKHFIDDVVIVKDGKTFKRVPQVLDCWFESGSMPYAQKHYPFSISDEEFDKIFPADFIAEGLDQTRGWFYTLSVLSAALGKGPAFKNVVVNGIVLAEDGKKMSKRLKNYPQPDEIINELGADALRIYLLQSAAVHGDDLRFSKPQVVEMMRRVLLPFWNAYVFFATYAAIDEFDPEKQFVKAKDRKNQLDQWIIAKLKRAANNIHDEMEGYHLAKTVPPLMSFIDDLNNWYIRRSRRRFWKSENDNDKLEAFSTLYEVLVQFSKITASFIPYLSDAIFQKLKLGHPLTQTQSVHLETFPVRCQLTDEELQTEKIQDAMRDIVGLGRELREKLKIRTRQPLATLFIGQYETVTFKPAELDVIKSELNVKDIKFENFQRMATWKLKPDFKVLGKQLGTDMKAFQAFCQSPQKDTVLQMLDHKSNLDWGTHSIEKKYLTLELQPSKEFGFQGVGNGNTIVAFDPTLSEDLLAEGAAREFVHTVQEARKESQFQVDDKIVLRVNSRDPKLLEILKQFRSYIEQETLSTVKFETPPPKTFEFLDKTQFGVEKI